MDEVKALIKENFKIKCKSSTKAVYRKAFQKKSSREVDSTMYSECPQETFAPQKQDWLGNLGP